MNDLAKSMALAKAAGNTAALDQFRAQYRDLAAQAGALRAQANQSDQPSAFLVKLDQLSDSAIATARKFGDDVSGAVGGASTLVRLLPWIVVAALVVLGIGLYRGSLKLKV